MPKKFKETVLKLVSNTPSFKFIWDKFAKIKLPENTESGTVLATITAKDAKKFSIRIKGEDKSSFKTKENGDGDFVVMPEIA